MCPHREEAGGLDRPSVRDRELRRQDWLHPASAQPVPSHVRELRLRSRNRLTRIPNFGIILPSTTQPEFRHDNHQFFELLPCPCREVGQGTAYPVVSAKRVAHWRQDECSS